MQVLHQALEHDCVLMVSPWHPTCGPLDLLHFHGTIYRQRPRVLVDENFTHKFFNHMLVKKLGLSQLSSSHTYVVLLINGDDKDVWDKAVMRVVLEVQEHTMNPNFHIMHVSRDDIIVGCEWLHGLGSLLKRSYQPNTLAFNLCGVHILLMREQDVPASSLICHPKVTYLINNNEISILVLGYLLSSSLSIDVCISDVSLPMKMKLAHVLVICN